MLGLSESLLKQFEKMDCGQKTWKASGQIVVVPCPSKADTMGALISQNVIITACGGVPLKGMRKLLLDYTSHQDQEVAYGCNNPPEDVVPYLPGLNDDVALRCFTLLPAYEHWRLALLSRRHRALCNGRLLASRRKNGLREQWICMYSGTQWTAFCPRGMNWKTLAPSLAPMAFMASDKESLSAGCHLLWIGREIDINGLRFACFKYDFARNTWNVGPDMIDHRCLFASATLNEYAYVAGGMDMHYNVINKAERYNSVEGVWEPLASMNIPRHKCSGFFMDGKFYAIGGRDRNHQPITSGEEYDLENNVWRIIPNLYPDPQHGQGEASSPPLVAVAGNELYAIATADNLLKAYNKRANRWRILGHIPVRADAFDGWGIAFKGVDDHLFVIGGNGEGSSDIFCCQPQPGAAAVEWQFVTPTTRRGGGFIFNCAVISC